MESISSSLRIEFSLMLFFFYQEGSLYETRVPRWRIKKLGDGDTVMVKSERSGSVWFYSKANK